LYVRKTLTKGSYDKKIGMALAKVELEELKNYLVTLTASKIRSSPPSFYIEFSSKARS
jgi:hypothetical protein